MPHLDSALIVADDDGGVRVFLGAAPDGVRQLAALCDESVHVDRSWVMPAEIRRLARTVDTLLPSTHTDPSRQRIVTPDAAEIDDSPDAQIRLPIAGFRFYPQMLGWVTEQIRELVFDQGIAPDSIAVLAPYVSDALRFSLQTALEADGIASTTHRPSRALHAEPSARCLTTLAALAHPLWGIAPSAADVAMALALTLDGLDPVRAHLLAQKAYDRGSGAGELQRFGSLRPDIQQRVTYIAGETYDRLRDWLYDYRSGSEVLPLDQFWARLFGELLSQPGFGFHRDFDAGRVAHQLVTSARNFRWALDSSGREASAKADMGREYIRLLTSGAVGALYSPGWRETRNAVLIAPAYTFLMRNRPVDIQFWLDIGSSGWWERLYQPLTHPHVMSHSWPPNQPWTDFDEYETRQRNMRRLALGLLRRTRQQVYLAMSNYSESGYEQRGPLLTLINRILSSEPAITEGPGLMGIAPSPS